MTRVEFYWCLRGMLCGFIDLFCSLGRRRCIMENGLRQQSNAASHGHVLHAHFACTSLLSIILGSASDGPSGKEGRLEDRKKIKERP